MKRLTALGAAALAAGCTMAGEPPARADGEARLAAELRDYEQSGPPVSCVSLRDLGSNRSVGETAIIFEGSGNRIWVNRPPAGCPSMNHGRALVVRTPTGQLCRGEIATVVDPTTSFSYGSCGLGDFVPYRRRAG